MPRSAPDQESTGGRPASRTIGSADGVGAAAGFGGQGDLKSDRNETLFVADTGNGAIRKVAVGTRTVTTVVGVLAQHAQVLGPLPGGLAAPLPLALDGSGALYISDDWAILVAR